MVKTSVIIVNYNGSGVIIDSLEKLGEQTTKDFEVLVVDNASADDSVARIRSLFPAVKILALDTNLGFTGGNIEGLKHSHSEYIALLNPDTEVAPDWLESLMRVMDNNPQAGICASKLIVYGTDLIDSAGDGCMVTGRGFKLGEGERQSGFNELREVFGACGGAMLIRRSAIDQIGFFDDDFFLIYEDTDFSFRARLAGWQCLFVPDSIVYHKVRTSIGTMSDIAVYYSIRNARCVLVKNMPLRLILKYLPSHVLQEVGQFFYFVIRHGKWRPYFKANYHFFCMIRSLITKRREVMKLKTIDNKSLEGLLTPLVDRTLLRKKISKLIRG